METKKLTWERPILRELGGSGYITSGADCTYGDDFSTTTTCKSTGNTASTCTNGNTAASCVTTGNNV